MKNDKVAPVAPLVEFVRNSPFLTFFIVLAVLETARVIFRPK